MDLKRVKIQHKRYTLEEWTNGISPLEDNPELKIIPYLAQGEIGTLLSPDKSQVLEVRIGTDPGDKQKFSDGLLLGNKEQPDICIKQYPNNNAFPTLGNENQLYINQSTNSVYRWDDKNMKFYECSGDGSSWKDIEMIDGGNSQNLPSVD